MKLIWKSIKLVIFCKLLKMMMGIGLLVFSIFMFKGYSDYKDALEKNRWPRPWKKLCKNRPMFR